MMGVANVNGVISDMDKARVSAEVIITWLFPNKYCVHCPYSKSDDLISL